MRKKQKQEILEFVASLQEAHKKIKEILEQGNVTEGQNMLCDCQECAIELGNIIETFEGEGAVTVSYIEKYCELLYHYYEKLNTTTKTELLSNKKISKKLIDTLNKQLSNMENSIKNDIKTKKEIVFFPYKASMWDSLESVYLAAKEDENCDAYCVPIPYYDKNPDGSLGKMHYEGREYPENIEVIDWRTYDVKERKPDVVYIHNPYDNCNIVTSVHPDYYAEKLKQYTDKLVYIPYFVLQEIEPDNQEAIDNIQHFIWTPGVIYSDQVIVQSEKMRQIYINEYLKAAKKNGWIGVRLDRASLEKKILGTGSPKLEKAKNSKKEDYELPEEWIRIIQKPDGSWKKIVLYNTGVSALLGYGEEWVDKIENTLKVFQEEQDKIVLLWRPHPLIENTMKTMRPETLKKYRKIKERYVQEGWGIYDESTDMNRAVAISDAYYGDGSSMVELYRSQEKPVMIQNPKILNAIEE
ncbi:MAG: hypothetical protein IKL49_02585 [Lachnospiraceae bacterium]|nr:hypothetical protein [Lachnospiraceae bacterium]